MILFGQIERSKQDFHFAHGFTAYIDTSLKKSCHPFFNCYWPKHERILHIGFFLDPSQEMFYISIWNLIFSYSTSLLKFTVVSIFGTKISTGSTNFLSLMKLKSFVKLRKHFVSSNIFSKVL